MLKEAKRRRLIRDNPGVDVEKLPEDSREKEIIKRDFQISPYLFRLSYTTCLYRSGMGLKALQEKTRHVSLDALTRHYIDDSQPAASSSAKILEGDAGMNVKVKAKNLLDGKVHEGAFLSTPIHDLPDNSPLL